MKEYASLPLHKADTNGQITQFTPIEETATVLFNTRKFVCPVEFNHTHLCSRKQTSVYLRLKLNPACREINTRIHKR